jgi:hypothetical protein
MIKTGDFAEREFQIRAKLTEAVAAREGLDLSHSKFRDKAFSIASQLLAQWQRNPGDPQDEIERLCQDNLENDRDFNEHRQRLKAERDALIASQRPARPDLAIVTVHVRDELTGKLVKLMSLRKPCERDFLHFWHSRPHSRFCQPVSLLGHFPLGGAPRLHLACLLSLVTHAVDSLMVSGLRNRHVGVRVYLGQSLRGFLSPAKFDFLEEWRFTPFT